MHPKMKYVALALGFALATIWSAGAQAQGAWEETHWSMFTIDCPAPPPVGEGWGETCGPPFSSGSGLGVDIYVVSSGVEQSNPDVVGRAQAVRSWDPSLGGVLGGAEDQLGWGTILASIAAGAGNGVAQGARIKALRVTTPLGWPGAAEKQDWIARNAIMDALLWISEDASETSVVLLDFVYRNSGVLSQAVANLVSQGHVVITGAGNGNRDDCSFGPANVSGVVTVGGMEEPVHGASSYYVDPVSNQGTCVDMFGPIDARSAVFQGVGSQDNMGNTIYAAAVAAGVAATIIFNTSCQGGACRDALIDAALVGNAIYPVISGVSGGTGERVLHLN